jgi:hypothetical protein
MVEGLGSNIFNQVVMARIAIHPSMPEMAIISRLGTTNASLSVGGCTFPRLGQPAQHILAVFF